MTTNALPDDMRRLLEAVVAALDVPLPDVAEDDALRADLLAHRACDVRIICSSALQDNNIQGAADHLQQWTASRPVTFVSWQSRTAADTTEDGQS